MKKTILSCVIAIAVSTFTAQAQFIDLISWGSSDVTVEGSVTTATYSQSAGGITYSPSVALGDTLGAVFNSVQNWTVWEAPLSSEIFVSMTFTGANPNLPFNLIVFNSDFSLSNQYSGTTVATPDAPYFQLGLISAFDPSVLSNVGGAQFTWDGGATVNATTLTIATVPEPSTYALLALGALALGGYASRRRSRK